MKTAIITSIQNVDQREVANGIVRYRRLAEFLFGIRCDQGLICSFDGTFDDVLRLQKIVDTLDFDSLCVVDRRRAIYPRTIFVLENGSFYETKLGLDMIFDLRNDGIPSKMCLKNQRN